MALDDDIRALSRVELLAEFTQDQLRLLAFGAETVRVSAGRELYRENNVGDCAFVVVEGEVALTRERNGENISAGRAGPGSILGGFALIAETRRLTGAVAATDVEAIRLNRRLFRRILEEYPETAEALARRIAADFQRMVAEIAALEGRFST